MARARPILLAALAATLGCATPQPVPRPESLVGLEVGVSGGSVQCENVGGEREVRFLTYERADGREAYGVYGLHGAKARMDVPRPLTGDPIAWDGVDAEAGLARVIATVGVEPAAARALVDANRERWFTGGLRVFFVCEGEPPPDPGFDSATWPVVVVDLE